MGDDALASAQRPKLPEAPEDYYTLQEAALELGIDVALLHQAVKENTLTCCSHFGRHMVTKYDMENYRLRTQTPPEPPIP